MTALPILFSGPMVRALIEGRKTQTRRRVKARDLGFDNEDVMDFPAELLPSDFAGAKCPYGKPGDLLWVRETCRAHELSDTEVEAMEPPLGKRDRLYGLDGVVFAADNKFAAIQNTREAAEAWVDLNHYRGKRGATVPPIHMPRWASRLTLRITAVRVQRLNDINGLDARAEGLVDLGIDGARWHWERNAKSGHFAPWRAYRALWDSINGSGSWGTNPWVWALTFDVLHCNVDQVQP